MLKWYQMRRKQTTPVQRISFAKKGALIVIAFLMAVSVPVSLFADNVQADQYDERIRQLQAEIDQYQSKAKALNEQANNLQNAVNGLNNEISAIQAQININQTKFDQLTSEIKLNEQKIDYNQDVLGKTIADIYVDDKISPLEMLASSKNIGEYVDKQEYRSTVRDRLTVAINDIKIAKKELEKQKVDVQKVLADQQNARAALDGKRAEQQNILDKTRGDESAYQQLSATKRADQSRIREQQQAAIQAAINRTGGASVISVGVDGAYPWSNANCPMLGYYSTGGADGNGGDGKGYGCRQCASYAAWRVARETGRYPTYWGNATNFPSRARAAGYSTGVSARAGSLGVMHAGNAGVPEGHVVYVEAVVDGGSSIIVSQYNYNYGAGYGMYSKMKMSTAVFDEYIYI